MRLRPPTLMRVTPLHLLEAGQALLVILLAVALARLFWLMITPLGPVGDWRPQMPSIPALAQRGAIAGSFDPFGGATGGPELETANVSGLTLKGVRLAGPDGGGAIVQLPDETQASFSLGDEILPDVRLAEIRSDRVVLERGGARQELVLEGANDIPGTSLPSGSPVGGTLTDLPLAPRVEDGKVTGIAITQGDATMLAAVGLKAGDVIVAVRGKPIASSADLQSLRAEIRPGARIALTVERGSGTIPVSLAL